MVQSNLAARYAQADPRLDALREDPGGYWARRSAMSWT
jgi:hypothetical protein